MFDSCFAKQQKVKALFASALSPEDRYQVIVDLGKSQPKLAPCDRVEENRIKGCQSTTYIKTHYHQGRLSIAIESDALISAGLGQLLSMVYNDETPDTILNCPPTYLQELGIQESLSPGRANGLANMYFRLRQEALLNTETKLPPQKLQQTGSSETPT